MKKTLLLLLLLIGPNITFAQDFNYSTNLFYGINSPTNIFAGTNSTDPARDTYIKIWNKLNADITLLWSHGQMDDLSLSNLNNTVANLNSLNPVTNHQAAVTLNGTFSGNFTNGFFAHGTITNSVITNSTLAGNGQYVTAMNGANITGSTVNSNALDAGTKSWINGHLLPGTDFTAGDITAASFKGSLKDYGGGTGSSTYVATANGDGTWNWAAPAGGSGGGNMNFDGGTISSDGSGNVTVNNLALGGWQGGTGPGAEIDYYGNFNIAAGFSSGNYWQAYYDFGVYNGIAVGYDDTAPFPIIPLLVGLTHKTVFTSNSTLDDGAGNMAVYGTFSSDSGQIYSDGSGNLTAQTFNPVSDRARKENIKLFDPQTALQMALAMTNYTWRFKGSTNLVAKITQLTNSATPTNRLNHLTLQTNYVARIRPATGKEFGPMAQDWHQATGLGGGTNISLTSMNGLLLGAVQGLNQKLSTDEQHPQIPFYTPPSKTSTTFGYGSGLLACDANNLYVSTGTNAWSRITLPTNAW